MKVLKKNNKILIILMKNSCNHIYVEIFQKEPLWMQLKIKKLFNQINYQKNKNYIY